MVVSVGVGALGAMGDVVEFGERGGGAGEVEGWGEGVLD